ncbi:MAG TPA: RIP metalloprotease RseP, partial [Gemmatimonadaceae bacterium]|nr:RIP metalloprotease RseP [Gemmatimonadaceae bacterium]
WDDIDYAIDTLPGDSLVIRTNRMAVTVPAGPVKGAKRRELINAVLPLLPPVIDAVIPGGPAEGAGLRDGDSVVAVNGAPVHSWQQVRSQIEGSPGRPMTLDVARGAARATITVTPEPTKQKDSAGGRDTLVGKIGAVARQPEEREPVSLTTAVRAGATETWFAAGLVVRSLQMLATGEASIRQLGGPVAIGGAAAQAARRGWEALLSLLALISINVAVFNLLPVPVLDGGQILLLAAERVKGSALSLRTREYLMRAGLAFIVLLLIVVMYNDVVSPIVRRLFKS